MSTDLAKEDLPREAQDEVAREASGEMASLLTAIVKSLPSGPDDEVASHSLLTRGLAMRALSLNSIMMSALYDDCLSAHDEFEVYGEAVAERRRAARAKGPASEVAGKVTAAAPAARDTATPTISAQNSIHDSIRVDTDGPAAVIFNSAAGVPDLLSYVHGQLVILDEALRLLDRAESDNGLGSALVAV
jgi:hypothetical protein